MRTETQTFSPDRGRSGESDRVYRLRVRIETGIKTLTKGLAGMELKGQADDMQARLKLLTEWLPRVRRGENLDDIESALERALSTPPSSAMEKAA